MSSLKIRMYMKQNFTVQRGVLLETHFYAAFVCTRFLLFVFQLKRGPKEGVLLIVNGFLRFFSFLAALEFELRCLLGKALLPLEPPNQPCKWVFAKQVLLLVFVFGGTGV
jgi:hypothetical protein